MLQADDNGTSRPTANGRFTWLKGLVRFVGWWFGFFALLGPLSTCPVCGQPGCPGGAASAGLLGGVLAALLWLPRRIVQFFSNRPSVSKDGEL